jgi:hypothetical protein
MTHLTPTQDLVLEVLAARYRLGETLWTFRSNSAIRTAANTLYDLGYITVDNGVTENTFRASLTEKGKKLVLDAAYKPPVLRKPPPVMDTLDAGFDWKQGFTAGWLAREGLGS